MLLTPQHRRSSRISRKAKAPAKKDVSPAKKDTYDLSLQCDEEFASDWNAQKGKRDLSEEDIYTDCPVLEGL